MPVSPFGSRINKREWDKFYFRNNIKIVYDEAWCFDSFSMNKVKLLVFMLQSHLVVEN